MVLAISPPTLRRLLYTCSRRWSSRGVDNPLQHYINTLWNGHCKCFTMTSTEFSFPGLHPWAYCHCPGGKHPITLSKWSVRLAVWAFWIVGGPGMRQVSATAQLICVTSPVALSFRAPNSSRNRVEWYWELGFVIVAWRHLVITANVDHCTSDYSSNRLFDN